MICLAEWFFTKTKVFVRFVRGQRGSQGSRHLAPHCGIADQDGTSSGRWHVSSALQSHCVRRRETFGGGSFMSHIHDYSDMMTFDGGGAESEQSSPECGTRNGKVTGLLQDGDTNATKSVLEDQVVD
jgi:hypothetical protein